MPKISMPAYIRYAILKDKTICEGSEIQRK